MGLFASIFAWTSYHYFLTPIISLSFTGHPNVHYLNLMNNDIGDEGAKAIGELLKENKGIVELVGAIDKLLFDRPC